MHLPQLLTQGTTSTSGLIPPDITMSMKSKKVKILREVETLLQTSRSLHKMDFSSKVKSELMFQTILKASTLKRFLYPRNSRLVLMSSHADLTLQELPPREKEIAIPDPLARLQNTLARIQSCRFQV